jgi:hypothetical protein
LLPKSLDFPVGTENSSVFFTGKIKSNVFVPETDLESTVPKSTVIIRRQKILNKPPIKSSVTDRTIIKRNSQQTESKKSSDSRTPSKLPRPVLKPNCAITGDSRDCQTKSSDSAAQTSADTTVAGLGADAESLLRQYQKSTITQATSISTTAGSANLYEDELDPGSIKDTVTNLMSNYGNYDNVPDASAETAQQATGNAESLYDATKYANNCDDNTEGLCPDDEDADELHRLLKGGESLVDSATRLLHDLRGRVVEE